MMKYYFSATNLSAYPSDMLDVYESSGTLPKDLIELSNEEYEQYFLSSTPANYKLASDEHGKPCFIKNMTEQEEYEAQVQQVDATRRSLYLNVDALRNEAAMIRDVEEDEAKAADYEQQARALYLKIRDENPWPTPPTE